MKVIGYIGINNDKQELERQKNLLLKVAQQHNLQIDEFMKVEISPRKNIQERRIVELLKRLDDGDVLLVAKLSRLGRNMFGVINFINELSESGVEIVFVQQPELPTRGPQRKLLLAIHRYFAKAEREFISIRAKQGLAAVRVNGKRLGRPKGSRDNKRVLDPYREKIKGYLALKEDNTATHSDQNQSATKEANLPQFVAALRSTR